MGKSSARGRTRRNSQVHPHACGEILGVETKIRDPRGSPPRVWGNQLDPFAALARLRFTPTRVGKSESAIRQLLCRAVHPHACGEIAASRSQFCISDGSPPRVWGNRGSRCGAGVPCTVHPHACGEILTIKATLQKDRGSPPRVWGNHFPSAEIVESLRFTPTRVGKSSDLANCWQSWAVHPHACGEIFAALRAARSAFGSPPRVWGNHAGQIAEQFQPRFTPTRVGKSPSRTARAVSTSVHPHACGEIDFPKTVTSLSGGSPPRVWGNRQNLVRFDHRGRFTPTRVGKSLTGTRTNLHASVHPHACGEIFWWLVENMFAIGSPPRVWGNPSDLKCPRLTWRFTPTRVGKSPPARRARLPPSVHPHACGEITSFVNTNLLPVGSPPRVWGNLMDKEHNRVKSRFTPTRVGKSPSVREIAGASGGSPPRVWGNRSWGLIQSLSRLVHPHACGEISSNRCPSKTMYGSPPRVWGNHRLMTGRWMRLRFTPTRVGKSGWGAHASFTLSVHPHACGEIWGILILSHCSLRFTPTRVGKSKAANRRARSELVHPHACGEILFLAISAHSPDGSPPRVWGNRRAQARSERTCRFTPTRVGKSSPLAVPP